MRNRIASPRLRLILIMAAVVAGFALMTINPRRSDATGASTSRLHAIVRAGLGEIYLAATGESVEAVRRSADSIAGFINKRSGFRLTEEVIARLALMEQRLIEGKTRRISADDLSDALTEALIDRLYALTDGEIEMAAESLRGFNAPDLPEAAARGRLYVRLRANRLKDFTPEAFIERVKSLRRLAVARPALATKAYDFVSQTVESRLQTFGKAAPVEWGNSLSGGLSPLQALLVAYSTVSDDPLWYSQSELQLVMKSIERGMARNYGRYPSADGKLAYGSNGYIFSFPVDTILDPSTVNALLSRIEERSAQ